MRDRWGEIDTGDLEREVAIEIEIRSIEREKQRDRDNGD